MKLRIETRCDEDGYRAWCPELVGCPAGKGPTPGDAMEQGVRAIRGYLASVTDFVPEKLLLEVDGETIEADEWATFEEIR
jgi:predicted RNase H-like HicB family nuclease